MKYKAEFVGSIMAYMLYMMFMHVYSIVVAFKNYMNGKGFQTVVYYDKFGEGIPELIMILGLMPACVYATYYVVKLFIKKDVNEKPSVLLEK